MNTIPCDILLEIIKFTDEDDHKIFKTFLLMLRLSKFIYKNLVDYTYALGCKVRHEFYNQKLLIANTFNWVDEDFSLKIIIDYVRSNDNLCIAGGYTTLMFLNKDFKDYPDSDIDIFIMNVSVDPVKTFEHLCKFILRIYPDTQYNQTLSVFDLKIKNISRTFQIILTKLKNPTHVLSSFDFSHNKSCYYLDKTYSLPDAIHSRISKKTYYYAKQFRIQRLVKAKNLGLVISNIIIDEGLDKCTMPVKKYELLKTIFDGEDLRNNTELIPASFRNFSNIYAGNNVSNIFELDRTKIFDNIDFHFINLNETNLDLNKINIKYITSKHIMKNKDMIENYDINTIYNNKLIVPFITLKCTMRIVYGIGCLEALVKYDDIKQLIYLNKCVYDISLKLFSVSNKMKRVEHKNYIGIGVEFFSYKDVIGWISLSNNNLIINENIPCVIKIIPVFTYNKYVFRNNNYLCEMRTAYYLWNVVYDQ